MRPDLSTLAPVVREFTARWDLVPDGELTNGHCSLVLPVRTRDDVSAVLKIGFPEEESEHEHIALRRWGGHGAVRLLAAEPHHRALLLERLSARDLTAVPDGEACRVVAGLYGAIHVPVLPQLRSLSFFVERWNAELAALPRSAPIPHRLVEQAVTLGRDLIADPGEQRLLHTDLHYANVLEREADQWAVIDPKPVNGDPHYEIAPMLWNRWEEISGDVRDGVRRRFWSLVDAAGFDEERARAWVIIRMVHNAMWAVAEQDDSAWLTRCIAVAKAVQD